MISIFEGDDFFSSGITFRQFQTSVNSFCSRVHKISHFQRFGSSFCQKSAKFNRFFLCIFAVNHDVQIFIGLLFNRVNHFWMRMSQSISRNPGYKIEISFSIFSVDVTSFSFFHFETRGERCGLCLILIEILIYIRNFFYIRFQNP